MKFDAQLAEIQPIVATAKPAQWEVLVRVVGEYEEVLTFWEWVNSTTELLEKK